MATDIIVPQSKYVMQIQMGVTQGNFRFLYQGPIADAADWILKQVQEKGYLRLADFEDGSESIVIAPGGETRMGMTIQVIDNESFKEAMNEAKLDQMRRQAAQFGGNHG